MSKDQVEQADLRARIMTDPDTQRHPKSPRLALLSDSQRNFSHMLA